MTTERMLGGFTRSEWLTYLGIPDADDPKLSQISLLPDPGADRILFWDDSAGVMTWLTPGTNLSITGTTLNAAGGGGGGLSDGDYGDIVVSSGGTVMSIDSGVLSAFGRTLIDDADAAAARTTLGLVIGTNVQAYDADLASWAAVTRAAGFDTFTATPSSANLRSLLTDETGSGAAVFGTGPTISAAVLTGTTDLSGGQIKFPATQSPSADANTLDDYEEGTVTPQLLFGGGSTGMTFTTQLGRYTKIGRLVFYEINLTLSAKGSSTGNATISGLPFTSAAAPAARTHVGANGMAASVSSAGASVNASNTTIALTNFASGAAALLNDTHFTATSTFNFAGFYTAS